MLYTSLDNKKIKNIKKLYTKKYRDEYNEFIIEGEHLIIEAYKKGLLKELILEEGTDFKLDIKISYVTSNILKHISELTNPPKIIGVCKKLEEKEIGNKIVILDGIQDPGNLGTIIRSSVAFNVDTIVLSKDCVDLYNSKVIRATQGMIFNINIIERDLNSFISALKEKCYKIYGTKVNGGKSLKNVEKSERFAIIMGICKKIEEKEIGNKIVILDGIQDPGNLGTIIRSSVAFNIDTIVLSKDTVDLYNSKVIRATQGMIFNVNIIERDLYKFIPILKEKSYKIYGTKVNGGKSLKNVEKSERFAIIMGNEGNGVKADILDMCSDYIYIDMNSSCESLNVGVATSIILYELDK